VTEQTRRHWNRKPASSLISSTQQVADRGFDGFGKLIGAESRAGKVFDPFGGGSTQLAPEAFRASATPCELSDSAPIEACRTSHA
jgi:hypothetical protein